MSRDQEKTCEAAVILREGGVLGGNWKENWRAISAARLKIK
jgi:hypothetical protein